MNGQSFGVIWTHPLRVSVHLEAGVNSVELVAASTLINEMMASQGYDLSHRHDVSMPGWPYYGKVIDDQLAARMNLNREHMEQKTLLESGVWGNVFLIRRTKE